MSTTANNIEDDPWTDLNFDDLTLQKLLDKPLDEPDTTRLRDGEQHEGFDNNVGDSWIYPSNLPCRAYQLSIVQSALYRNTLVVLPTGLGKTFIAAVVMYNIYRWYPRGKVIFMAPTRPLVNQQIEACQKIMPFPKRDTVELTGKLQRSKRSELWKTKRVFFATPQVVQSDIFGGRVPEDGGGGQEGDDDVLTSKTEFPFDQVKLLVIDEAHKAKGKYAYTEVTQAIAQQTKYFRVLALSATPGRTMEDVAEVCRNLFISHIEVRWDTSIDVLPYVHKRSMETVVVSLGEQIMKIREELLQIIDPYLRQLTDAEMLSGSLTNINRNFLLYEQKRFRDRSFHNGRHPEHSAISSNFAICISLYHALELLERHGLRVFLNNFEEDEGAKAKFVLKMDRRLRELVDNIKHELGPNPFEVSADPMTNGQIAEMPKNLDFGHPKFEKARECLVKHFQNNEESRAIVFCEYRESVMLIYRMLLQHVPMLKPRCFVGQGGTGSLRALTQKRQIEIMNDFRSGKSNILIATSIGEEGIDVGEVDLIVCFDISTSNPTRFVQRIGRTGRKKNGHVVMLVTEGREQQLLKEVMANKDQTNKKLLKSVAVQQALYKHAPRMVPTEFKPKCIQTFVKSPEEDEEHQEIKAKNSTASKLANKSKPPEKGTQDLRKFFNKNPKELDKEDLEYFEIDTKITQAKPGVHTQQKMEKSLDKMKNLFTDLQSPLASQTQKAGSTKQMPEVTNKMSSHRKLNTSQGSMKDFLIDLKDEEKRDNDNNKDNGKSFLKNPHPEHVKSENNFLIDLNDEEKDGGNDKDKDYYKSFLKNPDPEHVKRLKKFLNTITTPEVLKRAEIDDIGYHLKSKEMSKEMKKIMLLVKPEYIKENLEQMNVLKALQDSETNTISPEEKSIKEINQIILDLFGGLDKVENFLEDLELKLYKQKCLESDNLSDEEEDPEDEQKFKNKLDKILDGLGDGKKYDNYDWVQARLKQTNYYKELMKSKEQNNIPPTNNQESMVYDTFVEQEDESLNDFSFTESKYCSQWLEFNKPDIAFKSTPVQGANHNSFKRPDKLKKTSSLLTKLEETKEEYQEEEGEDSIASNSAEKIEKNPRNCSTDTKQVQSILTMLEKKIKENSMSNTKTSNESLDDCKDFFNSKRIDDENKNCFKETKKSSFDFKELSNDFENFSLEEDELFKAAAEAEMKFTQSQSKDSKKDKSNPIEDLNGTLDSTNSTTDQFKDSKKNNSNSIEDPNKTPDIIIENGKNCNAANNLNSTSKLTPTSLNSTPDFIELIHNKPTTISTALPMPPAISIQQELDIDMEAFMEPFPEEEDLIKTQQNSFIPTAFQRRESFKENLNKDLYTRESPDLFAEDFTKSPIKPICNKNTALASKLAAKVNAQKCHSSVDALSVYSHKSPQTTLFSTQNPCKLLNSPSSRPPTDKQKHEKSPSLFDLYMTSTKGKGKIPKSLHNISSSLHMRKNSPAIPATQQNESLIVVRKRNDRVSKRKIFDSDSEESADEKGHGNGLSVLQVNGEETEDDSDFERIAETQGHNKSSVNRHRRKRRRFNSFINREAAVSGSENSEDEADHTLGHYVLDSVVVASDDEDPDQASTSHMQTMYLQSLKSPQQRRGAFKIPAPRVYNDHSKIFSQAVLPEEKYSQYVPDSFVVEEDDSFINDCAGNVNEVSMCPLEKAEKILKERRKAKKLGLAYVSPVQSKPMRKTKIVPVIEDSSSDEFD